MWPKAFENMLVLSNILILMKGLRELVKKKDYGGEGAGPGTYFLEDGACLCTVKSRSYFHI